MNILKQLGVGSERDYVPLCRGYLLAVFNDLFVYAREDGDPRHWRFRWAIGVLADGQHEMLGIWHDPAPDEVYWHEVTDDLMRRGIERIRFIAGLESSTGFERAAQALCLDADALPSSGQLLRQVETGLRAKDRHTASDSLARLYRASTTQRAEAALSKFAASPVGAKCPALVERFRLAIQQLSPFYASAPRIRRVVRNADASARQLNRAMQQSIKRHGSFPSVEAATSFVAKSLIRTEAYCSAFAPSPAAGPLYRAAAVCTRSSFSAACY